MPGWFSALRYCNVGHSPSTTLLFHLLANACTCVCMGGHQPFSLGPALLILRPRQALMRCWTGGQEPSRGCQSLVLARFESLPTYTRDSVVSAVLAPGDTVAAAQVHCTRRQPPAVGTHGNSRQQVPYHFFPNSRPKFHQVFAEHSHSSLWVSNKPLCGFGSGLPGLVPR